MDLVGCDNYGGNLSFYDQNQAQRFIFMWYLCSMRAKRYVVRGANHQKQKNWRYQTCVLIGKSQTW